MEALIPRAPDYFVGVLVIYIGCVSFWSVLKGLRFWLQSDIEGGTYPRFLWSCWVMAMGSIACHYAAFRLFGWL